ncbi:MAG: alpha/beta fold hydrolase [Clostridia bacterium]|nr:alpha/beta fold hydrolase [Clostridia bacterium]
MKETSFTFASPADGLDIHVLLVEPTGDTKGTILMAHGVMEYKERYLPMMRVFAENGFVCAMNDHRGYGKSIKNADDYGYTYEQGANGMMMDTRALGNWMMKKYYGKKHFLYGHSMGALLAVNYLKTHSKELHGAILSALPAANPAASIGKQYLRIWQGIKGARFRDQVTAKLVFDRYINRFKAEGSQNAWINSDPERVKAYEEDPMCGGLLTIDGYRALIDLMASAYDAKSFQNVQSAMPVEILAGSDDPCANGETGARKGREFLKSAGFTRASYTMYPGMRHEIHNEPDGERVITDMVNQLMAWL